MAKGKLAMTQIENYVDLYNQIKQNLDGSFLKNSIDSQTRKKQPYDFNNNTSPQSEQHSVSFSNVKGISHDINNMLSVITGYLELIKEDPHSDHTEIHIERSLEASEMLFELNKLLLSKVSGVKPFEDLDSIVEAVKQSLKVIVGVHSEIECKISVAPNTNFFIINPLHLKRIIQNLTKNAIDSMPEGGTLSISFENEDLFYDTVSGRQTNPYVKISIRDEGMGIDDEKLKNIFNSGYSSKINGNGLGLRISQYLAQYNDGHIEVSSKKGEGTVFTLHFPATDAARFSCVQ